MDISYYATGERKRTKFTFSKKDRNRQELKSQRILKNPYSKPETINHNVKSCTSRMMATPHNESFEKLRLRVSSVSSHIHSHCPPSSFNDDATSTQFSACEINTDQFQAGIPKKGELEVYDFLPSDDDDTSCNVAKGDPMCKKISPLSSFKTEPTTTPITANIEKVQKKTKIALAMTGAMNIFGGMTPVKTKGSAMGSAVQEDSPLLSLKGEFDKPQLTENSNNFNARGAFGTPELMTGKPSCVEKPSLCKKLEFSMDSDDEMVKVKNEDEEVTKTKTIHELREAGETKRFHDAVTYILDGVGEKCSLKVKISSSMEFIRKLMSRSFKLKLRAESHCISLIFESLYRERNMISNSVLAVMTGLLIQEKSLIGLLMDERDDFEEFLIKLLETPEEEDPFKKQGTIQSEKSTKGRKFDQDTIEELRKVSYGMKIIQAQQGLSLSILGLTILYQVCLSKPRTFRHFRKRFSALGGLEGLFKLSSNCISELLSQKEAYYQFHTVDCIIQILDLLLSDSSESQIDFTRDTRIEKALANLLRESSVLYLREEGYNIRKWLYQSTPEILKVVQRCLLSLIRFWINFTNRFQESAALLGEMALDSLFLLMIKCSRPHLPIATTEGECTISHREKLESSLFDMSALCIGLLSNLMHANDKNRDRLHSQGLGLLCIENASCFKNHSSCNCNDKTDGISLLTETFVQRYELLEETHSNDNNVLGSYLAILLGCSIRDKPEYQNVAQRLLPNQSWKCVIALLEEFIGFNHQLGTEHLEVEDMNDNDKPMILHVMEMVQMLKAIEINSAENLQV